MNRSFKDTYFSAIIFCVLIFVLYYSAITIFVFYIMQSFSNLQKMKIIKLSVSICFLFSVNRKVPPIHFRGQY